MKWATGIWILHFFLPLIYFQIFHIHKNISEYGNNFWGFLVGLIFLKIGLSVSFGPGPIFLTKIFLSMVFANSTACIEMNDVFLIFNQKWRYIRSFLKENDFFAFFSCFAFIAETNLKLQFSSTFFVDLTKSVAFSVMKQKKSFFHLHFMNVFRFSKILIS